MKAVVWLGVLLVVLSVTASSTPEENTSINSLNSINPQRKLLAKKKKNARRKNRRRKNRRRRRKRKATRRRKKSKFEIYGHLPRLLSITSPVQLRTQLFLRTDPTTFEERSNRITFCTRIAQYAVLRVVEVYITAVRSTKKGMSVVDLVINPDPVSFRPLKDIIDLLDGLKNVEDIVVTSSRTITTKNDHACSADFPFFPYGPVVAGLNYWEYNGGPKEVYREFRTTFSSPPAGILVRPAEQPVSRKDPIKVVVSELDLDLFDASGIKREQIEFVSSKCRDVLKDMQRKQFLNGFFDKNGVFVQMPGQVVDPYPLRVPDQAESALIQSAFVDSDTGYNYYGYNDYGNDNYGYAAAGGTGP